MSETEHRQHLSLITIVTTGTPMVIEQIKNQLDRLVPVHHVVDMTLAGDAIERELAMVKVKGKGDNRVEALRLADAFRARVIDATTESFVFEITGSQRQDRAVRRADAAARAGRGVAHRHRRDHARAGRDVAMGLTILDPDRLVFFTDAPAALIGALARIASSRLQHAEMIKYGSVRRFAPLYRATANQAARYEK